MEWNDGLSVAREDLDADHKHLVELLNRLHKATTQRMSGTVIDSILAFLIDHTKMHFAYEESLMKSLSCPLLGEHRNEHKALLEQISYLDAKLRTGQAALGPDTMGFLKIWLADHIVDMDKQLGDWLNSHPG
jgi:hemerythrin